ncbi:MAG: glycosyltransferase family 87 protein [Myxococcota bacterium]
MDRRALLALNLAVLVAGMGAVAWISTSATDVCAAKNCCDARVFATVGARLLAGGDPYAPVDLGGLDLPFLYPPPALPLVAAWGLAAPKVAHVAIAMATTAVFLAAVAVRAGPLAAVAAGNGGWTFLSAYLGQTGTLLGAGALAMLGGEALGGVALGLVGLKPHYAFCVAAACAGAGRWRMLAVAAAVSAGLAGVSLAAFGEGPWRAWIALVAGSHPERDLSLMSNWFAIAPASWRGAAPAVYAAAVAGCLAAGRALDWPRALATSLCLAAALVPHGHPYDLAVWVVPAVVLGGRVPRNVVALGLFVLAVVLAGIRAPLPLASLALAGASASGLARRDRLAASRAAE